MEDEKKPLSGIWVWAVIVVLIIGFSIFAYNR
jgi:hypothetical protein